MGVVGLRTASAAALNHNDTVYCLTPLHHQSGLLVALGGAVVGGTRIALSRGLRPDRFVAEIHQYGATVVSPTPGRCCAMSSTLPDSHCRATTRFGCSSVQECRPDCGSGSSMNSRRQGRRVLRHHRWPGSAGQCGGFQDREQGTPAARRWRGRIGGLRRRADLILEDHGFRSGCRGGSDRSTAGTPVGPIDPTASVKRACSPRATPGFRPSTCSVATPTAISGCSVTVAR